MRHPIILIALFAVIGVYPIGFGGAQERPAAVQAKIDAALTAAPEGYKPRTRHLRTDGAPIFTNRLVLEASPYLRQHAHNPVDWRPWGPEALAEAAALDRPIFLSVGYATCHWCHVMEEESFDDTGVAGLLNTFFIPIKVDREQRPDLDQIYMLATQIQNQRGGWPNSLFLTADGKPFHSGTYWPRAQFRQILTAVNDAWIGNRVEVDEVAAELSRAISNHLGRREQAAAITEDVHSEIRDWLMQAHNPLEGGFSQSQQFPQESQILYLIDRWRRTGDEAMWDMAKTTLDAIAAGGIHDHVGGGFHRYAVDPNWRTPHFEKMLYNQALLSRAFVEAWRDSGDPVYARAARRTFDYVLRDMASPEGAFYAAEDADSLDAAGELEEGAFYVWPPEDAESALGAEAPLAIEALGLDASPTLENGPVAHLDPISPPDFARLDPLLEKLRLARDARTRPLRDEKVIAGWNGLMIRALADGGAALAEPAYTNAAIQAFNTVWSLLWRDDQGLSRIHADGRVVEPGMLNDHAWLGLGALALWDATGDTVWLQRAELLAEQMTILFRDDVGRLKLAAADGPLGPVYDSGDSATPAASSSALELFARLARRSAEITPRTRADDLLAAMSGMMAAHPPQHPDGLRAAEIHLKGAAGPSRALGAGAVHAKATRRGDQITISLRIAQGWHVTGHAPEPDWAIGLDLKSEGAPLQDLAFPKAEVRSLGFSTTPLPVLEDTVEISARLAKADQPAAITLVLQPCSDQICLEAEHALFRFH